MKNNVEKIAKWMMTIFAIVAVVAVFSITVYMIAIGTPALTKVGVIELLFGTEWAPTASTPAFGIFFVILTSVVGTIAALLIGVPVGVLTAVFIAEIGNKKISSVVQPAVELLAAIPSVIYGSLVKIGARTKKNWCAVAYIFIKRTIKIIYVIFMVYLCII